MISVVSAEDAKRAAAAACAQNLQAAAAEITALPSGSHLARCVEIALARISAAAAAGCSSVCVHEIDLIEENAMSRDITLNKLLGLLEALGFQWKYMTARTYRNEYIEVTW